jgi:hydroxymethylbilane synthase
MSREQQILTIGTRGSQLALWQANWVKSELEKKFRNLQIKIEIIKTTGDKILDSPLSKIGDKGLFTKEIEQALLEQQVDIAIHSLKDVPTKLPDGLMLGAITEREDVHDVFIAHQKKSYNKIDELPKGAKIATGSLRRKAQLLNWRYDLEIIDIRGNLNTRFSKLDQSDWDGMILARAGVVRLGWESRISDIIPLEIMLPAVGQGALAVELRADDKNTLRYVRTLACVQTTISVNGERAFLRHLEGGCQIPIGAYGKIENGEFKLTAMIGSLDGKNIVRGKIQGPPELSENLATQLAQTLFDSGGENILASVRGKNQNLLSSINS